MERIKSVLMAVLLVLVIIVVLQNTQEVETKILFATITMPRALLLFLTLGSGIVIGMLYAARKKTSTS